MRQVVLDTETTGLYPDSGDRVISIGCVEIIDRKITGREWHTHLNPEGRESHPRALEIHGLTSEFLVDKPRFPEVKAAFADFLKGAELIIHNAPFDLGFLNAELARCGVAHKIENRLAVIDTLKLPAADGLRVGGSLNSLADRYEIDRSARAQHHGALVDAQLLARVYLAMTRTQHELDMAPDQEEQASVRFTRGTVYIPVIEPSAQELEAHEAMMATIRGAA